MVFASITFIALIYYLMEFSKKILMLAIVVNFFGVIWHFFLPDSFIVIGELFVREIKQTAGGRGASGFAAESSFCYYCDGSIPSNIFLLFKGKGI